MKLGIKSGRSKFFFQIHNNKSGNEYVKKYFDMYSCIQRNCILPYCVPIISPSFQNYKNC